MDQTGMGIDNNGPPTQRSPAVPTVMLPAIREDHLEAHVSPVPALTHSNVTSESASKLARAGQDKWKKAENRLRCALIESNLRDVRGVAIFTMQLTYPRSIKEQQCIDWASRVEERKRLDENRPDYFQSRSYVSWVNSLPDSRFEESDPYDIREMFRTLLYNWDSHEAANARNETKKAEIRLGVDAMIELAFQFRYEGKHSRRAEVDLLLPALPWVATAGNVCMIELPSDWRDYLTSLPNYHIFCADTSTLAVITFASEAKIKDEKVAARQLTYDLCSGQHQRRALGFDDSKIYGAVLVDKRFRIYESEWYGDTVRVFPTNRSFDLGIFDEFISCYITLCRLADFEASNVKLVFDTWNSEQGKQTIKDRNITESQKAPWRKESPASASGWPSKRRRGSGEADDMESLDTYDLEQFEDDADVDKDPTKVRTAVEEEVPPGGDPLNERNLRVFEYLARAKHFPGSEVGDVRTQNSAVSYGGMA
ncbi:hypothetical protein A7U60_g8252 [Sanghuangporus baumii]|uniref:Uncharacterized protein n=1 Tax=Sanghuangporus baumii TaxID=108892 RepID=A0A9Q5HRM2_SANBA|nr:hypothetical protein A7U60_g8252 [Sanghuangporus baumii]